VVIQMEQAQLSRRRDSLRVVAIWCLVTLADVIGTELSQYQASAVEDAIFGTRDLVPWPLSSRPSAGSTSG
jgi:hypothetical protein